MFENFPVLKIIPNKNEPEISEQVEATIPTSVGGTRITVGPVGSILGTGSSNTWSSAGTWTTSSLPCSGNTITIGPKCPTCGK